MCPPVMAMGRPQMTMRGPGASWRRMPSRSENATCPLAPFSRSVVTPECRSVRAFFAACKSRMSSSSLATSSPSVPSPGATRCVCASTRPGRIVPSAYSRRSTAAPAPGPIRLLAAWRLQELERRHAELIRGAGRDPEVEVASASRRDDVADSLDHVSDGLPGGVHGCDLQVDVLGRLAVVVVDVPREPGYARLYRLGRPFDVEILVPERPRLPGFCRGSP